MKAKVSDHLFQGRCQQPPNILAFIHGTTHYLLLIKCAQRDLMNVIKYGNLFTNPAIRSAPKHCDTIAGAAEAV